MENVEIKELKKAIKKNEAQRIKLASRLHHFQWNGNTIKENEYLGKLDDNQEKQTKLYKKLDQANRWWRLRK